MLETKQLSHSPLIQDISLRFFPGILYGILGPNGSGKTTFLKNLAGIWKPTSGKVLWNNNDLLSQERQEISKTLSLVPQTSQMPFDYSVTEVVSMGRYPHGKSRQDSFFIEQALKQVDAFHLRNRHITQLSCGERQRVYIARALVTESPILLLDEPTTSLDIRHQLDIWELLQKLREKGKTLIVATHDLAACEQYCDQVAILHEGRCVAFGTYHETMTPKRLQKVFGVKDLPRSNTESSLLVSKQLQE